MSWQDAKSRGSAAYAAQRYADAVTEFTAALESLEALDGGDAARDEQRHLVLSNRSACFQQLQQFEKGAADAEACTKAKPAWAKGYAHLGLCRYNTGHFEAAALAYTKAAELDASKKAEYDKGTARCAAAAARQKGIPPLRPPGVNVKPAGARAPVALAAQPTAVLLTRALLSGVAAANGVAYFAGLTAPWAWLRARHQTCLVALVAHAVVAVVANHGRPALSQEYGMRVLVDPTATRLFAAWALVVGHSAFLLAALLLPECAAVVACAAALLRRVPQCAKLAQWVGSAGARARLLDGTGNPYWKVNQMSAYLEVAALSVLVVGLPFPQTRNFIMLLIYGQSFYLRFMLEQASGHTSGALHLGLGALDRRLTTLCAYAPSLVGRGYGAAKAAAKRFTALPAPGQAAKAKRSFCAVS